MAINVLSNFLIAAGATASNALPANYVLYKQYSSPGCNDADSPNYIYGYRLGACFSKRIASMSPDGKVTITNFADDACTESSGVKFSEMPNVCGAVSNGDSSAMITGTPSSFAQAISDLNIVVRAPLNVYYPNIDCNNTEAVMIEAQTKECFQTTGSSDWKTITCRGATMGNSEINTCDKSKCSSTFTSCHYGPTIKCRQLGPGAYLSNICDYDKPVPNKLTTKSSVTPVDIGGAVVAVIVVLLLIIIIAVVVFFVIRKGKQNALKSASDTMDASETTYGSA